MGTVDTRIGACAALAFALLLTSAPQAKTVYHIGNSLTDQVDYGGFTGLAQSQGHDHVSARHVILGAPIQLIWEAPTIGFSTNGYGHYPEALSEHQWDAIVLQPGGDRSYKSEAVYADSLLKLALQNSPNVQGYVHMHWAISVYDRGSFEEQWLRGADEYARCRAFFEAYMDSLNAKNPDRPVIMIPNGEVMYQLHLKIERGDVPGVSSIWELYEGGVGSHLNSSGRYLVAVTHYAVIYQDDPIGLPTTGFDVDVHLARAIRETAREVILSYPRTGITAFGPYPVQGISLVPGTFELSVGETASPAKVFVPSNATDTAVSWLSLTEGVATVSTSGSVTAHGEGTASIVVATNDGSFRDTCLVTVTAGTPVSQVALSPDTASILVGEQVQLSAAVTPPNAQNSTVVWHSLDETFATVDQNGLVTAAGKGTVHIVATSVNGLHTDTARVQVRVTNNPPVVALDVDITDAFAPARITFSAEASYDPDTALTGDYILGYEWEFGDGSPMQRLATLSHTYGVPGTYTARVRVVDDNGAYSNWETVEITIRDRGIDGRIAEEAFAYAAGPLHDIDGGTGWGNAWVVQNGNTDVPGFEVVSPSLSYGDLNTSGGSIQGGMAYLSCGRRFDVTEDGPFADCAQYAQIGRPGTILWMSALLSKLKDDGAAVAVVVDPDASSTFYYDVRVGAGYFGSESDIGGSRFWSLMVNDTILLSDVPVVVGDVAMMVIKFEFYEDSTVVALHVNPSLPAAEAPQEPSLKLTTAEPFTFASFSFKTGAGPEQSAMDELRIGYTWQSVTPCSGTTAAVASPGAALQAARLVVSSGGMFVTGDAHVSLMSISGRTIWSGWCRKGDMVPYPRGAGVVLARMRTPDGSVLVQKLGTATVWWLQG